MITADLLPTKDWVLSGGVAGWVPYPELDFTLIAFLTVPTDERIRRLRRREQDRFQERVRAGGDMHAAHEEFIHWASRYDIGDVMGKTRERHEAYLAEQSCPVLRLDGLLPASQLVERVVEAARQRP
ncbi:MAG: hypothetical protein KC609_12655 [Myxococcales bacterium]|nr:hypothetical protein [Myxococcales bacterium]